METVALSFTLAALIDGGRPPDHARVSPSDVLIGDHALRRAPGGRRIGPNVNKQTTQTVIGTSASFIRLYAARATMLFDRHHDALCP